MDFNNLYQIEDLKNVISKHKITDPDQLNSESFLKLVALDLETEPTEELSTTIKQLVKPFIKICGVYKSQCGYCRLPNNFQINFAISSQYLSPADYELLSEGGFRRSGTSIYKPCPETSCCPCYPIKLDVRKFKLKKSHRKVIRRFRRYIGDKESNKKNDLETLWNLLSENEKNEQIYEEKSENNLTNKKTNRKRKSVKVVKCLNYKLLLEKVRNEGIFEKIKEAVLDCYRFENSKQNLDAEIIWFLSVNENWDLRINSKNKSVICNVILKLKRLIQMKYDTKTAEEFFCQADSKISKIECSEFNGSFEKGKATFKLKNGFLEKLSECIESSYSSSQTRNQNVPGNKQNDEDCLFASEKEKVENKKRVVFTVNLAECKEEYYQIFLQYEEQIHKNKNTARDSFNRFLCTSPILCEKSNLAPLESGERFGSFHGCLKIDGEVVYIGALDILPNGMNAVYLFYNPKFEFLSPGTLSALFEIALVKKNLLRNKNFYNYSMGFYIHGCPKMRYKERFGPSNILLSRFQDETIKQLWVELPTQQIKFDEELKLLEEHKRGEVASLPESLKNRNNAQRCIFLRKRLTTADLKTFPELNNVCLLVQKDLLSYYGLLWVTRSSYKGVTPVVMYNVGNSLFVFRAIVGWNLMERVVFEFSALS